MAVKPIPVGKTWASATRLTSPKLPVNPIPDTATFVSNSTVAVPIPEVPATPVGT